MTLFFCSFLCPFSGCDLDVRVATLSVIAHGSLHKIRPRRMFPNQQPCIIRTICNYYWHWSSALLTGETNRTKCACDFRGHWRRRTARQHRWGYALCMQSCVIVHVLCASGGGRSRLFFTVKTQHHFVRSASRSSYIRLWLWLWCLYKHYIWFLTAQYALS